MKKTLLTLSLLAGVSSAANAMTAAALDALNKPANVAISATTGPVVLAANQATLEGTTTLRGLGQTISTLAVPSAATAAALQAWADNLLVKIFGLTNGLMETGLGADTSLATTFAAPAAAYPFFATTGATADGAVIICIPPSAFTSVLGLTPGGTTTPFSALASGSLTADVLYRLVTYSASDTDRTRVNVLATI